MDKFREKLNDYKEIDEEKHRNNLFQFLKAIFPIVEEAWGKMSIHPDDPFISFGLPRDVRTEAELDHL